VRGSQSREARWTSGGSGARKRDYLTARGVEVQRQELSAEPAGFAHERHQPIVRRDDEAMGAAETPRRVDDHCGSPKSEARAVALAGFVI
jgi:hypothetical protein